jgi:hypothetical protein
MAYSVDTYSGSKTITVEDGTIDNSLDIRLIGKNYAGYGEVQNENFLHLLENFAGISAPPRPTNGQIWYDSGSRKLKFWDSQTLQWKTGAGAQVSGTAPVGLSVGDLWWDDSNEQLYAYGGPNAGFILIGPQGVPGLGTTEMVSDSVTDDDGVNHAIIKAFVNGEVVFVISTNSFVLDDTLTPITGFGRIKKGITLVNTNNDEGITDVVEQDVFWGTASSARGLIDEELGLLTPDMFYLKSGTGISFDEVVRFSDFGYTLGDGADLEVKIDADGVTPLIKTITSNTLIFQTQGNTPIKLQGANVLPGVNNTTDLGSVGVAFKNVYAANFYGAASNLTSLNAAELSSGTVPTARLSGTYNISISGTAGTATTATTATNANNLLVGSSFRAATESVATGSVVARTQSEEVIGGITITPGSVKGNYFVGIATSALFADLAEKYLADQNYEVGTVVVVGGNAEVTACSAGDRAFGAVSANPAYMMNAGLEGGTYIALKGRVPVKIIGPVKKGDKLIAAGEGCAAEARSILRNMPISAGTFPDTFAIALETNDDPGVKLVESIIL